MIMNTTDSDADAEASSAFFCPITHEVQSESTLSITDEPNLYSPYALVSYLTKVKSVSPMTRKTIEFGDLLVHKAGDAQNGVPLGLIVDHHLENGDIDGAASALLSVGLSIDTPFPIQSYLLPHRSYMSGGSFLGRPTRMRLTLLAWALVCEHFELAEKLVVQYSANVNCSWGRYRTFGRAWDHDKGLTSDTANPVEDEVFTRLSCMALALDETINDVTTAKVKWLMDHTASVNFLHMQQAVTLDPASKALEMQALLLDYPTVKVNYLGINSVESTFDHLIYRVVETNLQCDDAMDSIIAMSLRILDDPTVVCEPLIKLTGCGRSILRQFHWLKCNPFRTKKWLPILQRLLDMGAVVDTEMLHYTLGALPGDKGYPQQHRALDCRQWVNNRSRWSDEVVLAVCHSVPPNIIIDGVNVISRAVLYARSDAIIIALLNAGASQYDQYNGMTALQWAESLDRQNLVSRIGSWNQTYAPYAAYAAYP